MLIGPSWEPNLLPYWAPNLGPIRETIGGLGGVVVIDAAIGAHGQYFTVAATLDKSLTSHFL